MCRSLEEYRGQNCSLRLVHVGKAEVLQSVTSAGTLATEHHSMDRRLHNVVRSDVVVAGQRQAGRLHRDSETSKRT
ncbi:unnamed protein product, partial [Iphiclides podalirius]